MNNTRVTFIVPDLIDPVPYINKLPAQDLPDLAVFSSFLSRGNFIKPETYNYTPDNLYHCLLNQTPSMPFFAQAPIASLSMFFDNYCLKENDLVVNCEIDKAIFPPDEFQGKWLMRVDPCFMVPDRDQLVLVKAGDLDICLAEAKQLVAEINQFFSQYDKENFWTLKVISPERWYLISDKPIDIETFPPEKVIGQSVKSYIFKADTVDNQYWLNLFNEFQMILYQSDINKQRQQNNKVPINSVWFWGQDNCMANLAFSSDANNALVYTDNVVVQALAVINGAKYKPLPDFFSTPPNIASEQHITYVINEFSHAIKNMDILSWINLLVQFEKNFLYPVLDDINSGKIFQLEIISPTGTKLLVTKKLLRRWWRKNKQFSFFLIIK